MLRSWARANYRDYTAVAHFAEKDRLMSCPCGRGDYHYCGFCPYSFCSAHGTEAPGERKQVMNVINEWMHEFWKEQPRDSGPRGRAYYNTELMAWMCGCPRWKARGECPHTMYRPKKDVQVQEEYL